MIKSDYKTLADSYDRLRPAYPSEFYDILLEPVTDKETSSILEIGAGTGKATMGFLERGCSVDAIEVEGEMADLLKEKSKAYKIKVYVEAFESWQAKQDQTYDLICSAQAFHWIDPKIKYPLCYNLLKD